MKHLGIFLLVASSLQASSIFVSTSSSAVTFDNGAVEQGYADVVFGAFDGLNVAPLFCVDLLTNMKSRSAVFTALAPEPMFQENHGGWPSLSSAVAPINGLWMSAESVRSRIGSLGEDLLVAALFAPEPSSLGLVYWVSRHGLEA